jgi:hypothetical protein
MIVNVRIEGDYRMLNRLINPSLSLLFVVGTASVGAAATPVIGMASAQSGAMLDNTKVSGNATVFEGSTLQSSGYSRVHLSNGSRLDLAAGSKAQVFANHVSLEQGMSEVQSPTGFEINTRTLKIQPTSSTSIARVKVDGDKQILVTALNSPVNVLNKDGMLVARVAPGLPLSFLPQAGAGPAFDSTGCILVKGGVPVLVDSTGNQITEIRGLNLSKAVGNTVEIVGISDSSATPAGGASSVVKGSKATVTKKGGCAALATKIGASTSVAGLAAGTAGTTTAATGAGVGFGTGAVAGISIAAATAVGLGGAAAAGSFSSDSK